MRKSFAGTVLAVLAAGVVLAGCGSDASGAAAGSGGGQAPAGGSSGAQQQADHNQADLTFASQMIPHHSGALEMAKLVQGHTTNAAVLDLAKRVQAAQAPEIEQMTGWATKWGAMPGMSGSQSMPGMSGGSMPGMGDMPGMGGDSMPGAMSAEDMAKLGKAKGAAFDKMWLDMMIKHHEGAIEMARTELGQGANSNAKSLAQKIIDGQQKEITEMQGMLGKQ